MVDRKRLFFVLFLMLFCGLFLAACPSAPAALPPPLALPKPLPVDGPSIPFHTPNLRGVKETHIRSIANTDELLTCLDEGQIVYGIALQNANVRVAPQVDACRIGRIPRGSLVEITGAIQTSALDASQPISRATETKLVPTLGFVEDIQPIFRRTCNSCHSAVVKNKGLQVTEYKPLLAGSTLGAVVVPGDAEASSLWQQVNSGKMPLVGELSITDKAAIRAWIEAGAPERRSLVAQPTSQPVAQAPLTQLWLQVAGGAINPVSDVCETPAAAEQVVSSELLFPLSCGVAPRPPEVQSALKRLSIPIPAVAGAAPVRGGSIAPAAPQNGAAAAAPLHTLSAGQAGIQAAALNLPPASDEDGWLQPRGGFCMEQRIPQNDRGITALAFAPNGLLYMALDSSLVGENVDPLILYDAHHPSRSIAVYDPVANTRPVEIFSESTRITGMTYYDGSLYLSRAGEVGRITDGGKYERLAAGFAVNSQLFHANNGIAIVDGWLYISAGGVIDGYSDGPIVGISEAGAQSIVAGGNRFAARLVRAPLDVLLSQRSIEAFQTAARGLRNPYGLAADPAGRLWITDNGATNVPDTISAGDEVNVFNPAAVPPGTDEDATPYYGFPLALSGSPPDWYTKPVIDLPNASAPTSITWAYGTLFFGVYGSNPGLYRIGQGADGQPIAERVLLVWPLLATTTAPDGALWIGTGAGGLFRITPGC